MDAFYPRHELRARNQSNLMNSDKKYNDAYYLQQFRQFEQTRNFTLLSPIAQFDYMNEAFLGGGYLRFQKNWNDLHAFREQFLQWFKDVDAKDDGSPHWYNPYEDYSTSKKPVAVDQIPQYQEQIASFRATHRIHRRLYDCYDSYDCCFVYGLLLFLYKIRCTVIIV